VEDKDYEYLLGFVPDGHSFANAGIDSDYGTLVDYARDEWGVSIPEDMVGSLAEAKGQDKALKLKLEAEERERAQRELEEQLYQERQLAKKLDAGFIKTEMIKHKARILNEIKLYNAYCEQVTWSTIFFILSKSGGFHVLNLGRGGLGKSRSTLHLFKPTKAELKKKEKDPDYEMFMPFRVFGNWMALTGHITPKRFFEILQLDGKIILDESYMLLQNSQIKNMLRSALYDGEVVWYSSNGDEKHKFKGDIIFNSNQFNNKSLNDKALLDRLMVNNLSLDKDQLKVKLQHKRTYTPDRQLWKLITDRLLVIRNNGLLELTTDELAYVDNFINMELDKLPLDLSNEVSMRISERVETVFQYTKTFFGVLDEDLRQFCKQLAGNYFNIEHQTDLNSVIERILTDTTLSATEQLEQYKKVTATPTKPEGYSRASFFLKKKEYNQSFKEVK
jgi:hypothetical protein